MEDPKLSSFHKPIFGNTSNCPEPESLPTVEDFYEGLQGYAIALYVCSSIGLLIVAAEYVCLVVYCVRRVPASRRVPTLWVNSVFLVASIMAFFGIVLPQVRNGNILKYLLNGLLNTVIRYILRHYSYFFYNFIL